MISIIRGCAVGYVFAEPENLNFWQQKSTVLDGFFSYLAEIIISIRGCVACNDLSPWPIFSRSFGLDLENRVCSVASTVLHGFFPYLEQMIRCEEVCCMSWPLTLTYIFKVIQPCFDLGDPTWLNSVGNHEAAGGILRTQAFLLF